ncbi:hypothetical protein [Kitasatospora kifunensis]|uniref:Uncharacterized protein n=1 Tax=Kitasatospora kifunensis TaxID=58351 RepID=A0A7W7R1C3_KITKI|nr:hypothetical protein [Kitasatospora kifunensis]MBB4923631.1 hypothetical protein [Kitasatospora kifunensis]
MSFSDQPSVESAAAALQAYERARGAAVGPRPTPAWYPAARGGLAAVSYGLTFTTILTRHPAPWEAVLSLVAVLAFLGVHAAAVRPGGVLVLPKNDPRRQAKLRAHWWSMLVWPLGWLPGAVVGLCAGDALLGLRVGAVTSSLALGVHLWWSSARERRLVLEAGQA